MTNLLLHGATALIVWGIARRVLGAGFARGRRRRCSPSTRPTRWPSAGYLHSYLERALEGPPSQFHAGQRVVRNGYDVTILEVDAAGRPRGFVVQLLAPEETLVIGRREDGLRPIYPH